MLCERRHVYQVLTKRPSRARLFWEKHQRAFGGRPLPPHIWLGTSVEDQDAIYRVDHLRQVPAEVRFLSCEPLIGPVDLDLTGIHWVIVGARRAVEQ